MCGMDRVGTIFLEQRDALMSSPCACGYRRRAATQPFLRPAEVTEAFNGAIVACSVAGSRR